MSESHMIILAMAAIALVGGMVPWRLLIGREPEFHILS